MTPLQDTLRSLAQTKLGFDYSWKELGRFDDAAHFVTDLARSQFQKSEIASCMTMLNKAEAAISRVELPKPFEDSMISFRVVLHDTKTQLALTMNDNNEALIQTMRRREVLGRIAFEALSDNRRRDLAAAYSEAALIMISLPGYSERAIMDAFDESARIRQQVVDYQPWECFSVYRGKGLFYLHGPRSQSRLESAARWFQKALEVQKLKQDRLRGAPGSLDQR
jgi:hypothetical protein